MKRRRRSSGKEPAAVRSMCILCGEDFIITPQSREGENFSELWNEMWTAFCISLDLNPSSWTGISSFYTKVGQVPFCEAGGCRRKVISLLIFRGQLDKIRDQISKITNNMSMTIINTHTSISIQPNGDSLNLNGDENNASYLSVKKETEKLRSKLTKRFFPNLILSRLKFPAEISENINLSADRNPDLFSSPEMKDPDSEPESDFLDRNSSDESESEPAPKLQSKSAIPVNIKKSKADERGTTTYLYKEKWPVQSLDQQSDSKNRFKCLTCGRVRVQKGHIEAHIRRDHIHSTKFACKLCGKDLKYYGTFVSHMRLHRATSVSSLVSLTAAPSRIQSSRKNINMMRNRTQKSPLKRILISQEREKEGSKSRDQNDQNKSWLYMNKFPVTRLRLMFSGESPRYQCGICEQVLHWNHGITNHIKNIHLRGVATENNPNDSALGLELKLKNQSQSQRGIETNSIEKYCEEQNLSFKEGSIKCFLYRGKWPIQILGNSRDGNALAKNGYRCKTCGFTATLKGVAGHISHKHLKVQQLSRKKSSSSTVPKDQKKTKSNKETPSELQPIPISSQIHNVDKPSSSSSSSVSFLLKGKWAVTKFVDSNGKMCYKCDSCGFTGFDQDEIEKHIENEQDLNSIKLVPY